MVNNEVDTAKEERSQARESYSKQLNDLVAKGEGILNEYAKEAKDSQERNRKRQIVNSISDGLSALSNLYATTKGAPSAQLQSTTKTVQERYDREKARRDALMQEQKDLINNLRLNQAKTNYNLKDAGYRDALRDKMAADAKEEREVQLAAAKEQQDKANELQQQRIDIEKAQLEQSKILTQQKLNDEREYKKKKYEEDTRKQRIDDYKRKNGNSIKVDIDGQNFEIGDTTLQNFYLTAFDTIIRDIDDDILVLNKQLDEMRRRDRKKGAGLAITEKLLQLEEIKNQATVNSYDPKKKLSFAQTYYSISPTAKRSLKQLSEQYTEGLFKAENGDAALKETENKEDTYANFEI